MAVYNPPKKDVPIFDNLYFIQNTDNVTVDFANNNYLRYPNAQGTENLQDINVAGQAVFYSPSQFNGNVTVGSGTTANLTPTVSTNKSTVNIGASGQGTLSVNCPTTFGGFATTWLSSNINLQSGAKITQQTTSNVNTLSTTQFTNTAVGSVTSLATQPATTDNSTNVPTTAWVQSLISSLPIGQAPLPYLWLNYNYITASPLPTKFGVIALNFTGSAWNVNEYFTIRYLFSCEWNTSAGGNCLYNYTYAGIMNIYPNRVPGYGTLNSALLNGSVGGTVPTFGSQWYYSQEYNGQYNYNPANYTTNPPIYITSTSQSQFVFNYNLLANIVPVGCPNVLTCTIEILQKGPAGQTITSSGLFGNYQNTF